jgi:hypothetical protein
MEEKNKSSLQDALKKMPVYQPKDKLWDELSDSLAEAGEEKNRSTLSEALQKLPVYKSPNTIWKRIRRELPVSSPKWARYTRIAAVITGLLIISTGALWFIQNGENNLDETPTITSEKIITSPLPSTQEEIVEFQNQMELDEKELKVCFEQLPQEKSAELAPAMENLETLTEMRDSLILLLNRENRVDAEPRLRVLEKRRKALIYDLKSQVCE